MPVGWKAVHRQADAAICVGMKISELERNCLDRIKPLWESLNAYHLSKSTSFKKHFSTFTFERRMETLGRRDHLIAFVAEDNDKPVGYCIASVDGVLGEIDSLFVKEAYRGKGIGEGLMTFGLNWLEEHDCETIRVSIAEGNQDVLDFYRKFGFAERMIVMQRTHE